VGRFSSERPGSIQWQTSRFCLKIVPRGIRVRRRGLECLVRPIVRIGSPGLCRRFYPAGGDLKRHLPALLVCCLGIILYTATLPRGLLPGDSGELIAVSRTLSIAHPPGYPLYTLIGRVLSSLLAFGSVAYRYNLISALAASVSLGMLYLILVNLGVGRLLAAAVSLGLGTLQAFWLQATTAEVYAFNALYTVLLLHVALAAKRFGQRSFLLVAFLGGLALSHHLTMVYPVISALGIMVFALGLKPKGKTVLASVILMALGLSVWLYIPIRAGLGPPIMWGRTDTLAGFLSHISAQGYRWRLREFDPVGRGADLVRFLRATAGQAGVGFTIACLFGLGLGAGRLRVRLSIAAMVLLFGFHFSMYNIPDIESHMFPALIGVGVLAGLGFQRAAAIARRVGVWAGHAVVGAAFLVLALNLAAIRPRADQWFAQDYAEAIERSARNACGEDCIVITSGQPSAFPLLYASLVEPHGVHSFDIEASNPALIGADSPITSMEECVVKASETFGRAKTAMLGPTPAYVMGIRPVVCGMVYVLEVTADSCGSPEDFRVRGAAADLRDKASRLLSGSYYLHLAEWARANGDAAQAKADVRKAMAAASDDVATHTNGARLLLASGMVPEALEAAKQAVAIDPDFFGSHDLLGGMLSQAGRTDEAIEEYKMALKGNPTPAGVYSNLANAYLTKGDDRSALENFKKAIELDSTLVNAYVGMGLALEATGEPERALSLFGRARSMDKFSEPAYHAGASLLLRLDRPGEAAGLLRQGLVNLPHSALLLSDLGLSYLRSDAVDSAIVYLEAAVDKQPSLLNARGNLAIALERRGLIGRAVEQYRIYSESAPPGRSRDLALRALERLRASGAHD
jgi:tetratricopeptide (TPR) repeat protein